MATLKTGFFFFIQWVQLWQQFYWVIITLLILKPFLGSLYQKNITGSDAAITSSLTWGLLVVCPASLLHKWAEHRPSTPTALLRPSPLQPQHLHPLPSTPKEVKHFQEPHKKSSGHHLISSAGAAQQHAEAQPSHCNLHTVHLLYFLLPNSIN